MKQPDGQGEEVGQQGERDQDEEDPGGGGVPEGLALGQRMGALEEDGRAPEEVAHEEGLEKKTGEGESFEAGEGGTVGAPAPTEHDKDEQGDDEQGDDGWRACPVDEDGYINLYKAKQAGSHYPRQGGDDVDDPGSLGQGEVRRWGGRYHRLASCGWWDKLAICVAI